MLVVLDARYPDSIPTQGLELKAKKVVYLMTKCDLVNMDNLLAWKNRLQSQGHTVWLYQAKFGHPRSSQVLRRDQLLQKLVNMQKEMKTPLTVSMVGLPLSGKKSIHVQLGTTGDNVILLTPGLIPDKRKDDERVIKGTLEDLSKVDCQKCVEKVLSCIDSK